MKTVCVDLDGVLAQYDGWKGVGHIGDPHDGAVEFTKTLAGMGLSVVVFTTRCKEYTDGTRHDALIGIVKDWLDRHGFHYDEIYSGQGKPPAVAYVDDRAVQCRPKEAGNWAFRVALKGVERLVSVEETVSPQVAKEDAK